MMTITYISNWKSCLNISVGSSSCGIISFCILAEMSPCITLLLWSCCKLSSVTFNNWSFMLISTSWSTLYWWLNLRCWLSYNCCSKMSLAFLPLLIAADDASENLLFPCFPNQTDSLFHFYTTWMLLPHTLAHRNQSNTDWLHPFATHNVASYI